MKLDIIEEKIKERGLKKGYVAETLGLTTYGFSLKLNGINEFKWSEVEKLIEVLGLSKKEKEEIFFKN